MGGESELFRRGGAKLYLVDGDECVLMQSGEFVLLLVKHFRSPLAAVVAMVGNMQWPVGKDSLVNKLGESAFSFSNLPARLRYALALVNLEKRDLQRLEGLLEGYSTYMHSGGDTYKREAAAFWTRIARSAEAAIISDTTSDINNIGSTSVPAQKRWSERMSPKLAERMQQARRMSAVAKLFAKSVERGAINASAHIKMIKMADAAVPGGSQVCTELAVASVDAVARVVEAVETAGQTLLETGPQATGVDWVQRNCGQEEGQRATEAGLDAVAGSLITSAWTLNKVGLRMLFRAIASIQSKRDASRSVSRSSDHVSCDLHLSSPSSSSSGCLPSASSDSACNASSTQAVSVLRSPGALSDLTLDITPRAHAGSLIIPDRTARAHAGALPCLSSASAQAALQGPPRPPPLPPRFYGAIMPPRSSGVATAVSLSAAATAGPVSPGFRLYRPQQSRPSPASVAISMESSPLRPRPPPRPPSRSPD